MRPTRRRGPVQRVGVMAYTEEAIATMLAQRLSSSELVELVVVASGCKDRTAEIVEATLGRITECACSSSRVVRAKLPRYAGRAAAALRGSSTEVAETSSLALVERLG